jgi:ankyrin repeat protein
MTQTTDLTQAIKSGDAQAVQNAVRENPALATAPVEGAPTALLLALYYQEPNIAAILREARNGQIDVQEAAAMGDLHRMEAILAEEPRAFDAFSGDGFQPLGYAAFFGHTQMVRLLVSRGADLNVRARNPLATMPLHAALAHGHKEIARFLIENGADVNDEGGGWTPMHYCAYNGDVETARLLLSRGAQPRANGEGRTPADFAREKGFSDFAAQVFDL